MTAPTRLIWELAGKPSPIETVAKLLNAPGVCRMCGQHSDTTALAAKALGTNWTDHTCFAAPDSPRVCEACLWCCSGKPPHTLRMWTIIAAPGEQLPPPSEKAAMPAGPGLTYLNRATPQPVAYILAAPPAGEWLVSVAMSGQKHLLPYAPVNSGAGQWTVLYETTRVTATPHQWQTVRDAAMTLRKLGVPADAVLRGAPEMIRTKNALDTWRATIPALTPYLGAPLLELALWTITKETMK